jgi:hypothetical protein
MSKFVLSGGSVATEVEAFFAPAEYSNQKE